MRFSFLLPVPYSSWRLSILEKKGVKGVDFVKVWRFNSTLRRVLFTLLFRLFKRLHLQSARQCDASDSTEAKETEFVEEPFETLCLWLLFWFKPCVFFPPLIYAYYFATFAAVFISVASSPGENLWRLQVSAHLHHWALHHHYNGKVRAQLYSSLLPWPKS